MGVPHFTPQEVRALSAQSPVLAAAFAGARPIRHVPGSVNVSVPPDTRLEIPARLRESLAARVPTVGGMVADMYGMPSDHVPLSNTRELQARWADKPVKPTTDPRKAEEWRQVLESKRVPNPVLSEEVMTWNKANSAFPVSKHKVLAAAQSLLDLLPREMVQKLGKFDIEVHVVLPLGYAGIYNENTHVMHLSHASIQSYSTEALRSLIWHEMGHWLHTEAHLDSRLSAWRKEMDDHWAARTTGEVPQTHQDGWDYIRDGWIDDYSGRLYPNYPPGMEIPSTYLEQAAIGPHHLADMCSENLSAKETFDIVFSILGPAQP